MGGAPFPAARTFQVSPRGESRLLRPFSSGVSLFLRQRRALFGGLARPCLGVSPGKPSRRLLLGEGRRQRLSPAGRVRLGSTEMSTEPPKQRDHHRDFKYRRPTEKERMNPPRKRGVTALQCVYVPFSSPSSASVTCWLLLKLLFFFFLLIHAVLIPLSPSAGWR